MGLVVFAAVSAVAGFVAGRAGAVPTATMAFALSVLGLAIMSVATASPWFFAGFLLLMVCPLSS